MINPIILCWNRSVYICKHKTISIKTFFLKCLCAGFKDRRQVPNFVLNCWTYLYDLNCIALEINLSLLKRSMNCHARTFEHWRIFFSFSFFFLIGFYNFHHYIRASVRIVNVWTKLTIWKSMISSFIGELDFYSCNSVLTGALFIFKIQNVVKW